MAQLQDYDERNIRTDCLKLACANPGADLYQWELTAAAAKGYYNFIVDGAVPERKPAPDKPKNVEVQKNPLPDYPFYQAHSGGVGAEIGGGSATVQQPAQSISPVKEKA